MTEHTKGPWFFEYDNADNSGGGQWYSLSAENGSSLLHFPYNSSPEREVECLANAKLIAAAPDFYEAAKATVAAFEDAFPIAGRDDDFIYDTLGSMQARAYFLSRDALKKATAND